MSAWYAVVDTAQDSSLFSLVKACAQHDCLIAGEIAPVLAAAAPYLVRIDRDSPLMAAWAERGGGGNWGILCDSDVPFDQLRRHFKKFLNARLPDGTVALFRFYDPRVFRTYLRACTPAEAAAWFKDVRQYSVESEEGVAHAFRWRGGQLFDGDAPVAAYA